MPKCPHCELDHDDLLHFCPVTGKPIELGARMVGQTLLGTYRVTEVLGGSSIGSVYKAVEEGTGQAVTLKMLHPQLGRNAEIAGRYLAEVERARDVASENLGRILCVQKDESGAPIVVRSFLEGPSLAEIIEKHPQGMKPGAAVFLLQGLLAALEALHGSEIVNGDLTPRDVFVIKGPSGEAILKLAEIGERHVKQALPPEEALKPSNRPYRAPEQVRDGQTEPATDVFSAGVILYQMLTGRVPYPDGIPAAPERIPSFPEPSELRSEIPKPFDYTIRRALALHPRDRFKAPGLFAEAVGSVIPAEPVAFADLMTVATAAPAPPPGTSAPPGTIEVPFEETKPAPAAPVPAAPAKAPQLKPRKPDHAEESLAPIMPSRFAKWFIIVGVILGVVILFLAGRTIYLIATSEPAPDLDELAMSDASGDAGREAGAAADPEEDAEEEAEAEPEEDAGTEADVPADAAQAEELPAVDAGKTARITLEVEPAEASVLLDGKPVKAPYDWTLPADGTEHVIAVQAEGYEPEELAFEVKKNKDLEVSLDRVRTVTVTLEDVPDGATVLVDGKPSAAPYSWTMEPSKQPVSYRIEAEGYEPFEGAFVPDKSRKVTPKLKKSGEPTVVPPPEEKPEEKPEPPPEEVPGKKTKKPPKKKPGGGFVDEVPF